MATLNIIEPSSCQIRSVWAKERSRQVWNEFSGFDSIHPTFLQWKWVCGIFWYYLNKKPSHWYNNETLLSPHMNAQLWVVPKWYWFKWWKLGHSRCCQFNGMKHKTAFDYLIGLLKMAPNYTQYMFSQMTLKKNKCQSRVWIVNIFLSYTNNRLTPWFHLVLKIGLGKSEYVGKIQNFFQNPILLLLIN